MRFFYYFCSMKRGLILEGGGLRCIFTSAILDVLMENGITVDGFIGVSAGALFGINYKSQQPGRALRYNILLKDDPRYMGIRALLRTGDIVSNEFAYHIVPFEIDKVDIETFKSNPMEFWMACTDITSGLPIYHQMKEVTHKELDWMRASASMPLVSHIVEIDGKMMLDGGMTDSIPLKAFQAMGYERNIVILSRPRGYRKKHTHLTPLFKLCCSKYPKIAETMDRRHEMYNQQLDYLLEEEKKGNTMLIFPDEDLKIGRTELNERKLRHINELGRNKAIELLPQIKDFLNSK